MRLNEKQDHEHEVAVAWGEDLAHCVLQQFGNDLWVVLQALDIRWQAAARDEPEFPLPRLAVWEGDTRTIRLFVKPLCEKFSDWNFAARRACAHELFHAFVAEHYSSLALSTSSPALSRQAEEIAAEAFSQGLARNFCLTLEGNVLNFE